MAEHMTNIMRFNKATFEKNKLILQDAITIDEWKELGQNLKQVEGSVQFWIGDWARFGDKKGFTGKYTDPKVYDQLEELTGLDRSTIHKYKHIAEKTAEVRNEFPAAETFSHYAEIASLSVEKQKELLAIASDKKLSTKALRAEVKKTTVTENTSFLSESAESGITEPLDEEEDVKWSEKQRLSKKADKLIAEINEMPVIYRLRIRQSIKK